MGIKEEFLTVKEAADVLGYSPSHLRQMASKGLIPAYKRVRSWFFKKDELESHILISNKTKLNKEELDKEERSGDELDI
jgi:excisionase family DNA binding protein